MESLWIAAVFGIVAFVYSSAGLGGGSAYLAILALAGVATKQLPMVSLSCNLLVAGLSLFSYTRSGYLRWKLVLPFILTSIPCSFLGGQIHVSETLFRFLLAFSLWLAAGFFVDNFFKVSLNFFTDKIHIGRRTGGLSKFIGNFYF